MDFISGTKNRQANTLSSLLAAGVLRFVCKGAVESRTGVARSSFILQGSTPSVVRRAKSAPL